jgi:hypothetical protein
LRILRILNTECSTDEKEMKIVYNFVIQLVQAAIELSLTTTPSKGSTEDKRKAVVQYATESFW